MHVLKKSEIVFKKVIVAGGKQAIATLQLPVGTKVRAKVDTLGKNRASVALVLAIHDYAGRSYETGKPKMYNKRGLVYKVGEIAVPDRFSTSTGQCDGGIHFFRLHRDAVAF